MLKLACGSDGSASPVAGWHRSAWEDGQTLRDMAKKSRKKKARKKSKANHGKRPNS